MSDTTTIRKRAGMIALFAVTLLSAIAAMGLISGPAHAQTGTCSIGDFKNPDGTLDTTGYLACVAGQSSAKPQQPCPTADLELLGTVNPTTAAPGQTVNFTSAGGFAPGSQVTLYLCPGSIPLGTFTADANGAINVNVQIPPGTALGQYTIVAVGKRASGMDQIAFAAITIAQGTTSTGTLPVTGSDSGRMIALGAALVVLGGAAVFGSMRTRRPATIESD